MRSATRVVSALLLAPLLIFPWAPLSLPAQKGNPTVPAGALGAAPQEPDTLILTGARILPMTRDTVMEGRDVVIAGGRVVEIRMTGSKAPSPGTRVQDLEGAWLLPGLVDAHVHLREPPEGMVLFPATGVTTVVNLEGSPAHLALRDSIAQGRLFGPRIVSSGPFLEELVDTPAQARREVRRQADAGYDLIKVHGEMGREAFLAAADEARAAGLPFVGHWPEGLSAEVVLDRGLDALAHVEELLGSPLLEEPTGLSPDSAEAVARVLVESGTALVTTLHFFTGMGEQATDRFYEMIRRPELAYVSPQRRQGWLHNGHREYIEASELPWYETSARDLHLVAGAVRRLGGTVLAGTDTPLEFTIPGFSLHDELEHLTRAGLSPFQAIQAATVAPADFLGRPGLGRVEAGAAADLLVVREDPRKGLETLRSPVGVVLRGTWHPAEELDARLDRLAASYARDQVAQAARDRVLDEVAAVARDQGVEAALAALEAGNAAADGDAVGEAELNRLGYRFLGQGELETAVAVFRVNVRRNPDSANVYDSLGEAYLRAGRLDAAEESYRTALEMDPTMDSARRALAEIQERRGGR